jgi:outer membrane protein OmpA-like peptidoglycan-associated protein
MKKHALKIIVVVLIAACGAGTAFAIDAVMLHGGAMGSRIELGMSEQELADTVGAPDILKGNGSCYQYRLFDVSIMLDEQRRIAEIYAGRNFAGVIIKGDGTQVTITTDPVDTNNGDETPMEAVFRQFGEPLQTLRRTYAPSADITGVVTRETEYAPAAPAGAVQDLPLEYRGERVLYELYNRDGVLKYKYVLDHEGIAFWFDADKTPYATVVYHTTPPALPAQEPEAPLTVYFDFDRDAVKTDYAEALDALAQRMRDNHSLCIYLEGHADEKGTDPYNDELSMRRARAVHDALVSRDAPAAQMRIAAFGRRQPAAANRTADGRDNPEGRALNRRVMISQKICGH